MDGFGGRESGGLLEYIKFMAARTEDAEDEREAAILMLVKKGGEKQKMWLQRKSSVIPHVWKGLRKVVCSSTVHATFLNHFLETKILNFLIVLATNVSESCGDWTY